MQFQTGKRKYEALTGGNFAQPHSINWKPLGRRYWKFVRAQKARSRKEAQLNGVQTMPDRYGWSGVIRTKTGEQWPTAAPRPRQKFMYYPARYNPPELAYGDPQNARFRAAYARAPGRELEPSEILGLYPGRYDGPTDAMIAKLQFGQRYENDIYMYDGDRRRAEYEKQHNALKPYFRTLADETRPPPANDSMMRRFPPYDDSQWGDMPRPPPYDKPAGPNWEGEEPLIPYDAIANAEWQPAADPTEEFARQRADDFATAFGRDQKDEKDGKEGKRHRSAAVSQTIGEYETAVRELLEAARDVQDLLRIARELEVELDRQSPDVRDGVLARVEVLFQRRSEQLREQRRAREDQDLVVPDLSADQMQAILRNQAARQMGEQRRVERDLQRDERAELANQVEEEGPVGNLFADEQPAEAGQRRSQRRLPPPGALSQAAQQANAQQRAATRVSGQGFKRTRGGQIIPTLKFHRGGVHRMPGQRSTSLADPPAYVDPRDQTRFNRDRDYLPQSQGGFKLPPNPRVIGTDSSNWSDRLVPHMSSQTLKPHVTGKDSIVWE